jgi:hypothetical protein
MAPPNKVIERMSAGLAKMKPILLQQKQRDVSEADTVTLVKDLLADVFGYDKYRDLTGELAIRGTYCDLAIKLGDKYVALIEVKAIGIALDDRHVKQAIDYGANQGIEWVVLTNGLIWRLYSIIFAKPIDKNLVFEMDLGLMDPTARPDDADLLYTLTKEGFTKGAHAALRDKLVATSRFMLAALLTTNDNILSTIRRELKRVVDIGVDNEEIVAILEKQVIKRDALEGKESELARETIQSRKDRVLAVRSKKDAEPEDEKVIPFVEISEERQEAS